MITYKIFRNCSHDICDQYCPDYLPYLIKRFWKKCHLGSSNSAVIAFDNKDIIGFLRFDKEERCFWAGGTYVLPKYRNKKIAFQMWKLALNKSKSHQVYVFTLSPGGKKLVNYLKKKMPKYDWTHEY